MGHYKELLWITGHPHEPTNPIYVTEIKFCLWKNKKRNIKYKTVGKPMKNWTKTKKKIRNHHLKLNKAQNRNTNALATGNECGQEEKLSTASSPYTEMEASTKL
jgi:hypothetical protein